jgi:hypothetical protein
MPNLAFVNAELIVQEGGLPPLVDLLASSNEGIQQQAAGALWSLSVNGAASRSHDVVMPSILCVYLIGCPYSGESFEDRKGGFSPLYRQIIAISEPKNSRASSGNSSKSCS